MLLDIKESVAAKFNDLQQQAINEYHAIVATDQVRQQRLDSCNTCEHLLKMTGNCKICGCFVALKTRLKESLCPLEKW